MVSSVSLVNWAAYAGCGLKLIGQRTADTVWNGRWLLTLLVLVGRQPGLSAQQTSLGNAADSRQATRDSTISGVVTDPSGAVIPGATVVLHPLNGSADRTVYSSPAGRFSVSVPPGSYTVFVTAPQFVVFASEPLDLAAGKTQTLAVPMKIDVEAQQVEVSGDDQGSDPSRDGSSLVLKGSAVDRLPLDPTELSQELQGLAGGQAPEIYVDGFSGGTIPPRNTIREIRINQNPYSAMNDVNPINGRLEIFTKPGSNHLDFFLGALGNASQFNTQNPFVANQPPYSSYNLFTNLDGPLTKRSSYFVSGNRFSSRTNAIVNAQVLDGGMNTINFASAIASPSTSNNFSVRYDRAFGTRSTFIARYTLSDFNQVNSGVGQLTLQSEGSTSSSTTQVLQLSNSQIVSPHVVNDTRFEYTRSRTRQTPNSFLPTVLVEGAFNGGGSSAGTANDNTDRYELQNYLMASEGKHYLSVGGRLRVTRDANSSTANYNGVYTFASLASYAQALATGVGASQFSLTTGTPHVTVAVEDLGLFVQDDWKVKPNFTLSGGLRFETQNHIADHADFAPRLAFAWNLDVPKGKRPLYILRGGAGIFYTRFSSGNVLTAARQNGVLQQSYILNAPSFFFPAGTPGTLVGTLGAALPSTIYQISPSFTAPYGINSTIGLERRLGTHGSITASYRNVRGVHQQVTRNLNAPLPGTFVPGVPGSGVRPLGGTGSVYEFDAGGISNSNRISVSTFLNLFKGSFLFGYYERRDDKADTNGSFASNQYDLGQDYGRTAQSFKNYLNLGSGGDLPYGFRIFVFLQARSGAPFDITLGQDLNGDSIFNDRPSYATDLTRASVVRTAYGNFDTAPIAGQKLIAPNLGTGPALAEVNLSFGRRFHFGPELKPPPLPPGVPAPKPAALKPGKKPPPPERKYNLDLLLDVENPFNHVNLQAPVGTLNSPLFGHFLAIASNNPSANRVVNLQAFFRF